MFRLHPLCYAAGGAKREVRVRVWAKAALGLLAVLVTGMLALIVLVWSAGPSAGKGEVLLPPAMGYPRGHYFAYVGPWGGEQMALTKGWARRGDFMVLDHRRFPDNTRIGWRWPPFAPTNGPGVWGYNFVAYGNYASTPPEQPVAPIQVRNLKVLRQAFRWSISDTFGGADVLTEFFLRANPADEAAHRLEVGWFLHTPRVIRRFFEMSKLVGEYRDPAGRRWTVRISDQYCMFAPVAAGDIPAGEIDMLDALRWLQGRGLVKGDEWLWGLAIGAEPVGGLGRLTLQHWAVAWQ